MTKQLLTLSVLAFILAFAGCQDPKKTDQGLLPFTIHQTELDNGLKVVTVPYESPGLAAFYIVVRVGSREEVEPGHTGFAHFFEHMMFRGTDNYSKDEYSAVLKSIGAAANANTWLDRTVYHMTGNAEKLDLMFEIEADRFQNLNYSEGDFKVEAGAVKGEYTKNFASQYTQLNEAVVKEAFENHTYEHTTMGFFEDIVDMPNQFEYSLQFYDRFYRPEYSTVIVVGDVKPKQVNMLAQKYFGKWETGEYVPEIPEDLEQTSTRMTHIQNPNFIPTLRLAYKSPAFTTETKDVAAMQILAQLAFGNKSKLYQELVVDKQLALRMGPSFFFTRDPFLFSIQATTSDEKNLSEIRSIIDSTIAELKTSPVDEKKLADTKSNMKYNFLMGLDNPTDIAEELSYYTWVSGDPKSMEKHYANLEAVTVEDIQAAAQKYLVDEKLTIATISSQPEENLILEN